MLTRVVLAASIGCAAASPTASPTPVAPRPAPCGLQAALLSNPTARRWNTKLFRAARIRQLRAAVERPRLPLTFMPRVLLVVVAFAAATTALPHRLRRAKPEKRAADDHAPKPGTPSLAALESFLGGTAAEPVSRTLDGLDPEVALERASLTGMAREVGRLPDWEAVDGEEFSCSWR